MPLTILLQAFYFALSFAAPALMGGFFTGAPAWAQLLCLFLCGGGCFAASAYLGRKRLRLGLPLLAAGLAACLLLNGLAWATLLPAGALFFLCVLALRHRYAPQARPIESRITVIGLLLYAFGYAISFFTDLSPLCPTLGWLCLGYLALTLLAVNRLSVLEASGGQARRMLGGNQLLTLGFLLVLLVLVCFPQLRQAVSTALGAALVWLLSLFSGAGQGSLPSGVQDVGEGDLSQLGEATPLPEWLRVAGDILLYAVTIAVCLALACALLYALYKALKALYAKLLEWFQGFAQDSAGQDYVEENEQLLSGKSMADQLRKDMQKRLRKLFVRPPAWDRLNPEQKVRRLYARLLGELSPYVKHAAALSPEGLVSAAKKEQSGFAALYNAVRYGGTQPDQVQADQARKRLDL